MTLSDFGIELPVVYSSDLSHFGMHQFTAAHHCYLDSPQRYRTCSALVCLHSTSLHSLGLGCHIPLLYTELLHRRFSNNLPRTPMIPSFHEQEPKRQYKSPVSETILGNKRKNMRKRMNAQNKLSCIPTGGIPTDEGIYLGKKSFSITLLFHF